MPLAKSARRVHYVAEASRVANTMVGRSVQTLKAQIDKVKRMLMPTVSPVHDLEPYRQELTVLIAEALVELDRLDQLELDR